MFDIGVLLLVEVIYHRQIQAIGQPMANLGGPAVDGLLSGKDNVVAADFSGWPRPVCCGCHRYPRLPKPGS